MKDVKAAIEEFLPRAKEFPNLTQAAHVLFAENPGLFASEGAARLRLTRAIAKRQADAEGREPAAPAATVEWRENANGAAFQFKGALDRAMTVEELLRASGVDLERWQITGLEVKAWGVTSKLTNYEWTGRAIGLDGEPSGGRTVPVGQYLQAGKNYYLSIRLAPRKQDAAEALEAAMDRAIDRLRASGAASAIMPPADFRAVGEDPGNRLLEPCIFDLHLEKLAWGPETGGADWNTKIAASGCLEAAFDLLTHYRGFGRILLPLGNDFFHCDNMRQNTSGGSHLLDASSRWAEAWDVGCDVAINLVRLCLEFAPVDVLIIPGNHDFQRSTFMGRVLRECFNHIPHVTVDHAPGTMKRYRWGRTLLGFCHGNPRNEPYHKLGVEMMTRWPEDLPGTVHREWHVGDQHRMRSQAMTIEGYEEQSLRVRVIPSLCSPDFWHASNLYHNIRAAECYLWDKELCYVGHHAYNIALARKDRGEL